MRWLVIVSLVLLMPGCICLPSSEERVIQPTTTVRTTVTTPETQVSAFTAKNGLVSANQRMLALKSDAVLVGVSGSVEQSGEAMEWEYQYDSLIGKKGYSVGYPSGEVRERPYSFRAALGDSWVDSVKVASLCDVGSAEYSLEYSDGKLVWTVIGDGKSCTLDGATGTIIGGDE